MTLISRMKRIVSEQEDSHDTVGVICLDLQGRLAAGTSTSGYSLLLHQQLIRTYFISRLNRWPFKHPGRVGDSPVVGSGLYCDGTVGAAVATGDGEEVKEPLAFYCVKII